MELRWGDTTIQEDVYIVQGIKTLLLRQPAIEKLGLIPNIPGAYRIRAVNSEQKEVPKLDTKDDVVKAYPKLFSGLGKLKGEYTILLRDDAKPFCLYTPRRVPLPLMKKVEDEINGLVKLGVNEPIDESDRLVCAYGCSTEAEQKRVPLRGLDETQRRSPP